MSLFSSDAEQTLFSDVIWEVAFPMVNNRQATWKTVTLWVRVEEDYRHRAELLNMQPNNQVLNLYPWTKLVKFMKLLKCTCNRGVNSINFLLDILVTLCAIN
ncbi:hypothetical protein RND81_13G166000 [Saponaria officinalis]|uniref:Uncharacterized protein n=1 Tax=Saponaria officinalis TaxID=3572 RepID=A0AAW1GYK3_SAPOF